MPRRPTSPLATALYLLYPPTEAEMIGGLSSVKLRKVTKIIRKLTDSKGLSDAEIILRVFEDGAKNILEGYGYHVGQQRDLKKIVRQLPGDDLKRIEIASALDVMTILPRVRKGIKNSDVEGAMLEAIRLTVSAIRIKNFPDTFIGLLTRTGQRVRGRQRGTQISAKRKPEHERWRSVAEEEKENIRTKNPRKNPSKTELARKVKAKLRLSESVHTIRQRL